MGKKGRQTKYIFVTGGVLSGLGKGIAAASLGAILRARGFNVGVMKSDPYLNTDAGTLNPAEHGEVFVTADGAEADLDLGHYERFLDIETTQSSSLMNGRVYANLIAAERAGRYLGKTVQVIPHVTDLIQKWIVEAGKDYDIFIIEIGGTVGDYESLANIDAIRQFQYKAGRENVICAHLVYLPYLEASKELKTKPAQNSVRDLRAAGVYPDIIFARADKPVKDNIIHKISLFCRLESDAIVALPTAKSVYQVPLTLEASGIADYVCKSFGLKTSKPELDDWKHLNKVIFDDNKPTKSIGVVAKYLDHEDTYMSVVEAIKAAAWSHNHGADIKWIDAEKIEQEGADKHLKGLDGIIVPGGFGSRGVEGKIAASQYSRKNNIPYLGLCLGMQVAVIDVAREALSDESANTVEIDPDTKHPVIALMDDQKNIVDMGGTMRLGDYRCLLSSNSKSAEAYGSIEILERHRHRYEFNNKYREIVEKAGLKIVGQSPDKKLVEVVELDNHPFFVASQFHPEFTSRPNRPNPLFKSFFGAVVETKKAPAAGSKIRL